MKRLAISMMVFCSLMATSVAAWCGDNGNGTVTVNGLVLLKDAGCLGKMNWDDATAKARTVADGQCGLTDNSKPGDWRLPTVHELKVMYLSKNQFINVQSAIYWSSTVSSASETLAWAQSMTDSSGGFFYKRPAYLYVWPVRAVK